jgi:hypothetical protein
LTKESQRNIKQTQIKIKEEILKSEKKIAVIENRIEKFKRVMDRQETDELLEMLLRNINTSEGQLRELTIGLSNLKIEYELQNEKFNQTELEMTYYDVKEKINDWFFKLNVEEQRNELIRTIKSCKIFNQYLIIDVGKIVFLFDINQHYVFDMNLLDNLNKDEVYKEHFIEMKNQKEARKFNDKLIANINLNRDKNIRMLVFQYLVEKLGVIYNLNEISNLVSFASLRGLYALEQWQLETKD